MEQIEWANRQPELAAETRDYRIPKRFMYGLDAANLAWEVIDPIWFLPEPADDGLELTPHWNDVTRGQKMILALAQCERDTINGGFAQYFHNSWSFSCDEALEAARLCGLSDIQDAIGGAISVFPNGIVPKKRTERIAVLRSLATASGSDFSTDQDNGSVIEFLNDSAFERHNTIFFDAFDVAFGRVRRVDQRIARFIRSRPEEFFR